MPLKANVTPSDKARTFRLLIAWLDTDRLAFEVVVHEIEQDKNGTAGVCFALADFAAMLGVQVAGDRFVEQLRTSLLLAAEGDDHTDDAGDPDPTS